MSIEDIKKVKSIKISITDVNGKVEEIEGGAIIFYLRMPSEDLECRNAGAGIVGGFSGFDLIHAVDALKNVLESALEERKED